MHVRVLNQERLHAFGFVRRQIVADDMNLFAPRLMSDDVGEKRYELRAGMTRRCLAQHLAGFGVESGIERERAVTVVLKSVSLDAPRRERQYRIESIQRLNSCFLIDTEHCGMRRGVHVQPDDIGCLGFEVRVIRSHVAIQSVWLEPVLGPDASHHHVRNSQYSGKLARAPLRRTIAGRLLCPRQHSCFEPSDVMARGATPMPSVESAKSLGVEATLPSADVIRRAPQLRADRAPSQSLVHHHEQARTLYISRRRTARTRQRLQHPAFFRSQSEY